MPNSSLTELRLLFFGELQAKMLEYMDNGVRLGLLIDPQGRRVEIYRVGQFVEVLELRKFW
jgi:Uma2 family endonuclease